MDIMAAGVEGKEAGGVQGAPASYTPAPAARLLGEGHHRHGDNWYLQVLDLDIAWAHGVLGVGDWTLCMLGLFYGVVVIAFSLFVLHAVLTSSKTAAVISRWFMMFLHLELALYVALVIVKLPLLCKISVHFLTFMREDCRVLRFMFAERSICRIIIGSLCCWVFSSFAYLLAWGDAGIDDPTTTEYVQEAPGYRERVAVASPVNFAPPTRAYQDRSSFDRVQPTSASFARVQPTTTSFVGEPVAMSQKYEPRWVGASSKSFGGNIGGSFQATSGRYGQTIMPRASSSIQTNASEVSQHAAERQMLIKPPIVIH